jgi:hypothetical protein
MATFRIIGRVVEPKKRQGLGGLRVEAWDKDLILDDLVGSAITSEDGAFSMEFDEHYFQELFFDRNPDLFFRVFNQRHLLMSTENSILWNVTAGEIPILLEVPMDTHFNNQLAPDRLPLKPAQAKRLARMTGLKAEEFVGQSVADLGERMKWRIDPKFFFFQRVCGKVVKKDPISGKTCPVPFATVDVEDTDFHFLSYFPSGSPWAWHFWLAIDRETIATTKTDQCGNFCVWVPRFHFEWIRRWRRMRVCFPVIFRRPWLEDLIPRLPVDVVGPWPPIPGPDPGPLHTLASLSPSAVDALLPHSVGQRAARLARQQTSQRLGSSNPLMESVLQTRAFEREFPPPLPSEFHRALSGHDLIAEKGANPHEGLRSAIAMKLGIDPSARLLAEFNPRHYIGPFLRCHDIVFPEWKLIRDVPDITFRVGQDVDGDGSEETIYSEGFFDVRWDADPIPDVTLFANDLAKAIPSCDPPPDLPICTRPSILTASHLPLYLPEYFNATTGYAIRPNRPSKDGSAPTSSPDDRPDAETPFCGYVHLHGVVAINGAVYYRIVQSLDGGPLLPVTGMAWNQFAGGPPIPIIPDANGWYEVNPHDLSSPPVPVPRNTLLDPSLLLIWPTPTLGKAVLKIETADAAKNVIGESDPVSIQGDNIAPLVTVTKLAWKIAGEDDSAWRNLVGIPCASIRRGSSPKDIDLVFEVTVSAPHLRDASLSTSGCGSGNFVAISDPLHRSQHWHTAVTENSVVLYQRYKLDSTAMEGAYWVSCHAHSRSINPSEEANPYLLDGAPDSLNDWNYDPKDFIYVEPWYGIAIINGDEV